MKWKLLSHVWLLITPWAVAHQAPLSMEFSRQEYRSGKPFLSPTDLSNLRTEPRSPTLQAGFLHLNHQGSPRILDWVAYFSSNESSQPRNRTGISCVAGGFFTSWATREAYIKVPYLVRLTANRTPVSCTVGRRFTIWAPRRSNRESRTSQFKFYEECNF